MIRKRGNRSQRKKPSLSRYVKTKHTQTQKIKQNKLKQTKPKQTKKLKHKIEKGHAQGKAMVSAKNAFVFTK